MKILLLSIRQSVPGFVPIEEIFLADKLSSLGYGDIEIRSVLPDGIDSFCDELERDYPSDLTIVLWETTAYKSCQTMLEYFELADKIRQRSGAALYAGGYWAGALYSYYPERFDSFDALISGFNFDAVGEAIDGLARGQVHDRVVTAHGRCDWNKFDFSMSRVSTPELYVGNGFLSGYRTTFACPKNCYFCYNNTLRKQSATYSERSLDKVDADLDEIIRVYGHTAIQLKDRNFFCNRKRAFAVLDMINDKGLRPASNMDVTVEDADDEIFRKCRESNVEALFFGLESFHSSSLERFNKVYEVAKVEHLFELSDRYEVSLVGCLLFGLPWQTQDVISYDVEQACRYMEEHKFLTINFNNYHPMPDTQLQREYFPTFHEDVSLEELYRIYNFNCDQELQDRLYGKKFSSMNFSKLRAHSVALSCIRLLKRHHYPPLFHPILNWASRYIQHNISKSNEDTFFNRNLTVQNAHEVRRKLTRLAINVKKAFGRG